MRFFKTVLVSILATHFFIVLLTQCYQQNWSFINYPILKKLENIYIIPFFEQNWGMFAPNPPIGKKYIALEFFTKENNEKLISSGILNIHDPISQENLKKYFSLNQRLVKYFAECSNEIIIKYRLYKTPKELEMKSNAFKSIKNYSKYVLSIQEDFLSKINKKDSIFLTLFIIDEILPNINEANRKPKKYFKKIENIFLTLN